MKAPLAEGIDRSGDDSEFNLTFVCSLHLSVFNSAHAIPTLARMHTNFRDKLMTSSASVEALAEGVTCY